MDLEIRHLKLVQAIALEGGMTKAANRLHLTQSALSHQLKEIEERLNAPLYLRLKKKLVLTEAGERLLNSAEKVLQELVKPKTTSLLASGQQGSFESAHNVIPAITGFHQCLRLSKKVIPDVEYKLLLKRHITRCKHY